MKHIINRPFFTHPFVAPFTGAWIETKNLFLTHLWHIVAPFTGAWIETTLS